MDIGGPPQRQGAPRLRWALRFHLRYLGGASDFAGLFQRAIEAGYGFRCASLRFPKASAMEFFTPIRPESSSSLGMALVMSSSTPLVLLNEQLEVQAASGSFCRSFSLDCDRVVGKELPAIGDGEWEVPQLRSLLAATAAGSAAIDAYEMDLKRDGNPTRTLVVNAHVLDHDPDEALRLVVAG